MKLAQRVAHLPPYLFFEITKRMAAQRALGHDVISLAVGDPDLPPPKHVIDVLCEMARSPEGHLYPESDGIVELRQAMAEWYQGRFGVSLDPNGEVLSLIGSKEGVGHLALCLIDPGDLALLPDPGYVTYSSGTAFAGGEGYYLPLTPVNAYLPDLEAIPPDVAQRAKLLWLNYPNNPTAAVADLEFFQRVVAFAKKYDVAVLHDAPYTEVAFDGYQPPSFMQVKGAKEVGVELHSLSKTYDLQGWRVGMAVGNREIIGALMRVKSHIDSGIPPAIQGAAIAALTGPQDFVAEHNRIYQERRDLVVATLRQMGLTVATPKASLYVWAHIPQGYTSLDFTTTLLEEVNVVVTPGSGFGPHGEGYIRLSLTTPTPRVEEAMRRLAAWRGAHLVRQPRSSETTLAS